MKKIVYIAVLVFLTSGIAALFAAEQKPQTEFVFDLYRAVVQNEPDKNIMVSPYGAQWLLDLVRTGAVGTTKTEIEQVLGYTEPVKWESLFDGTLTTAAALWGQQGYPFQPAFLQMARNNFGATIEQADFVRNPNAAVKRINTWCSEKTKGKIPKILDQLDPDTRCVLINAIHFKADWKTPFSKNRTQDADFTLQNGTKTKAKMMGRTGRMMYDVTDEMLILELPYKTNGYAMLLLLPKNPTEFAEWELGMTTKKLDYLRGKLKSGEVNLRMPRFTVENMLELNEPLQQLGMTTAFRGSADFSKISNNKDLFMSKILQKTYIAVDEAGTEAAAVTGGIVGITSVPRPPFLFHADRPFLYAIVKEDTILFLGRFVKPETK